MNTIALVVLFALAVVGASWWITGRLGQGPLEVADSEPGPVLTVTESGVDLSSLTLPVVARGYRMADVDAVISELAAVIAEQQAQLRDQGQQPQAPTH